jgi:PKD repeat protein/lysophospholipase L1-like esterase
MLAGTANALDNTISCYGNSITEYGDPSWPEILDANLSDWTVINDGVAGSTALDDYNRLVTDTSESKYFIILTGQNDMGWPLNTKFNVNRMCKLIMDRGGVPVVCNMTPVNTAASTVIETNVWLKNYAEARGLPFIDFWTVLSDPSSPGTMNATISADGLHPTQLGYYMMIQAINLSMFYKNYTITKTESSNLITNYDFETDTSGWSGSNADIARVSEWASRGTYSVETTVSGVQTSFTLFDQVTSAINATSWYTMKGSARTQDVGATADLTIQSTNDGWADAMSETTNNVAANTNYTFEYVRYFSADSTGFVAAFQYADSDGITAGTGFYIDNVSFIESAYDITYTEDSEPAPTANFTADVTSGTAPLTVTFNGSISTGSTPLTYQWKWGDGTANGTAANPTHTFNAAGTYTVILTVSNSAGSNSTTKIITVLPLPVYPTAAFTANKTSSDYAPLCVQFTFTGANATSYLWDFGDDETSTAQNPVHLYTENGTYTVTLSVTNTNGTRTTTTRIQVGPVETGDTSFQLGLSDWTAIIFGLIIIALIALVGFVILRASTGEGDTKMVLPIVVLAIVIIASIMIGLKIMGGITGL